MWLPTQLQLQLLASALLLPTAFARPGPEADRVHHDQLLKRDPFLAFEKAYESAAILAVLPRSLSPAIVARAAAEDCSAPSSTKASSTSTSTSMTSTSTTSTSTTSTSTRSSTSSAPTPTSTGGSSGCTVAKWGQCGGKSYSGCTTCASGSTCKYSSDYFSQCL